MKHQVSPPIFSSPRKQFRNNENSINKNIRLRLLPSSQQSNQTAPSCKRFTKRCVLNNSSDRYRHAIARRQCCQMRSGRHKCTLSYSGDPGARQQEKVGRKHKKTTRVEVKGTQELQQCLRKEQNQMGKRRVRRRARRKETRKGETTQERKRKGGEGNDDKHIFCMSKVAACNIRICDHPAEHDENMQANRKKNKSPCLTNCTTDSHKKDT